ncbi:GDSL-type esterase/lipase family protein [Desulfosporosinus sp. BICA1-9]|uniref:GDSL-type esterase/lipase family protein n=1 Tax=Desulfosporosinus sp. BICA1-9 TaxID=1531958 RepID=UPI00054BDF35|nr:GDSL-type esterase/lipase family protein [Desulfosporosinus sp. BICA1-9]KJS47853.1 MAG: lysophospholipase [Peptococcaceae bacterium BRH_c23]KJS90413.1 MAG: lysophospholipase [Desulfosporosinus sp. BICA1-9]HBW35808.1 lysophospholipase [Desulfosporosinus sp.]
MRTYRLEIRLIQVAVALALIVLTTGYFGLWGPSSKVPVGETVPGVTVTNTVPTLSNSKIVALGDSFTLGYPLDPANSWTQRTAEVLEVTVVNKGKVRQTAKDLLDRFDTDVVAEKPGRVIIFAGIGDALQEVPLKDVQTNITGIVEKAKSNHIIPVLALPIGYPGVQKSIQETREWEMTYAQEQKILMLDFSTVLFDTEGKYLDGLTIDGKYPNAKGYKAMGDYAARILK